MENYKANFARYDFNDDGFLDRYEISEMIGIPVEESEKDLLNREVSKFLRLTNPKVEGKVSEAEYLTYVGKLFDSRLVAE